MKEKLKAHFLQLGPRRFVLMAILLLIVLDFVNSYYLTLYWVHKGLSGQFVMAAIQNMNQSMDSFRPDTLREMQGFTDNSFYFFLFLILINNLFFYLFYWMKRLWAQGYVLFYTITAALFSVTFIFDGAILGTGWLMYNILTIPMYLYLYTGVKLLKEETTLVPERKGR